MPLSQAETVIYTKMFKESPRLTGETMSMENVLKLCRDLGWSEKDYPASIIRSWAKHDGSLNCDDFLMIFQTPDQYAVWKAKYTRDFAKFDRDGSGKMCLSELTKYIHADKGNISEEMAAADAKYLTKYGDQDGDQLIDLSEFLSIMLP